MNKIGLIISREYKTRVMKKSFILTTILVPVGLVLLMCVPMLIQAFGSSDDSKVAVVDNTGLNYADALANVGAAKFEVLANETADSVKSSYAARGYDAFLLISGSPDQKENLKLFSESQMPISVTEGIKNAMDSLMRARSMANFSGHNASVDSLFAHINSISCHVMTIKMSDDGSEEENNAGVGMVLSMLMATVIYFVVLLNGSSVLTSVIDEKSNRIVEVLVSSVKPFDLMLGKVTGVALVVFTQLGVWFALGGGATACMSSFFTAAPAGADNVYADVFEMLESYNIPYLLTMAVVYFMCAYFIYASLFAAIGAAFDNVQDSQQMLLLVQLPLIASFYIALSCLNDPNSAVVFWCSFIPFTSPIVMMSRLPFGVPAWEVALSVALLVAFYFLTVWVASRIYRVGILMYGKKPSVKELVKWFRQG